MCILNGRPPLYFLPSCELCVRCLVSGCLYRGKIQSAPYSHTLTPSATTGGCQVATCKEKAEYLACEHPGCRYNAKHADHLRKHQATMYTGEGGALAFLRCTFKADSHRLCCCT